MREFVRKFEANRVLNNATANIFAEKEKEDFVRFKKHTINIPWYLMPIKQIIIDMTYLSYKNGLSDNCIDTVTIKRPAPYEAKDNE